jgi:glycine/D-amino acid oxidase-like deaminating enzyme
MSTSGVELQRRLASELAPQTLRNQGSICVAFPNHKKQLREDYLLYKRLQCDVRLLGRSEVERYHGSKAGFVAGLQFPRDCIVHSAEYARALLRRAQQTGLLTLRERCPRVCHVDDTVAGSAHLAVLRLADGTSIRARHAVLATGGLFMPDDLRGILRPCWSYFSYMAPQKDSPPLPQPNSPNFFTFDFSHDWCVTDGEVRISGEDHYSGSCAPCSLSLLTSRAAFKPPLWRERCEKLAGWLRHRYPGMRAAPVVRTHYGIYSDTPDALPIVGRRSSGSAVTYLLGCNAWGQSILSYCASLVPALAGVQDLATLPEDDRRLLQLISPARFTAKSRL